jgi:hypothetical protein
LLALTIRSGWDALPDSTLPDQLRALGYTVKRTGETQRILPHAIVENFVADRTGAFVPATAGSTRPTVHSVRHAGIVAVDQWELYGGPPPDQGMRIAP